MKKYRNNASKPEPSFKNKQTNKDHKNQSSTYKRSQTSNKKSQFKNERRLLTNGTSPINITRFQSYPFRKF